MRLDVDGSFEARDVCMTSQSSYDIECGRPFSPERSSALMAAQPETFSSCPGIAMINFQYTQQHPMSLTRSMIASLQMLYMPSGGVGLELGPLHLCASKVGCPMASEDWMRRVQRWYQEV